MLRGGVRDAGLLPIGERARASQALTNFPAIYRGFMAKGIAEADIKPRENVFTFNAWKALEGPADFIIRTGDRCALTRWPAR